MQINKVINTSSKSFLAQNDENSKHPSLQRRKIMESAGMGVVIGLMERAGGTTKSALAAGSAVGLLHYGLNNWNNARYDKYKPEVSSEQKTPVQTESNAKFAGFVPLIFGSLVFLVSAGVGAVMNKEKGLKKILTRSGIQALGLTGALHIITSTVDAVKGKKNKEQTTEIKTAA